MEQGPPLSGNVHSRNISLGIHPHLLGQGLRGIAFDLRSRRSFEVGTHRAATKRRRGEHEQPYPHTATSVAGAFSGSGSRCENIRINTGSTSSTRIGVSNIPPTTTRARGRCTWDPIPVERAAGTNPTQATT